MPIKFTLILGLLAYSVAPAMAAGSPQPDFGPNVLIFNPSMPAAAMQERIDKVYATQQNNQFGPARNAFLFAPGGTSWTFRLDTTRRFWDWGRLPTAFIS